MKKIFTLLFMLLFMCVFAVAAKADITVYVNSDVAPFIWWWGGDNGYPGPEGGWPGTYQLTEQWEDPNSGDKFWKWTFEGVTTISFLFNNGDRQAMLKMQQQTVTSHFLGTMAQAM